jgi:lipopolysaccharide transport system ATP-binding protein
MGSIRVQSLGKAYRQYPSPRARLAEWLDPRRRPRHRLRWVLRDVSFAIEPGESVGIIGVNGAGKSTLLKMITGTVQPTTGGVHRTGRVAALLELGLGFHGDFTGRQNVLMSGQMMGHSLRDIDRVMPEIEAFAEIGEYIDQPVRVYSSGMQVRLAFAVAVAYRPDILIVDEALAVGDVYFQQKCYQRIKAYMEQGTTLLFVTHGLATVLEVCSRAMYLRDGHLAFDGSPKAAVDLYQADLLAAQDQGEKPLSVVETVRMPEVREPLEKMTLEASGALGSLTTDGVDLVSAELRNEAGQPAAALLTGRRMDLRVTYRLRRDLSDPHVGFKVRNRLGRVVFETNTYCMGERLGPHAAETDLEVSFRFPVDLVPDDYTVTVGMANRGSGTGVFEEALSYLHDVLSFRILPDPDDIIWDGMVNLHPAVSWTTTSGDRALGAEAGR